VSSRLANIRDENDLACGVSDRRQGVNFRRSKT